MSLSTWFKDYLYIPLGGSRVSRIINIRNILIVWLLTGLWHGANLNFVLWGLYYGIVLILEKFILKKYIDRLPNVLKHTYTLFLILIGWLIFAFDDMNKLGSFAKIMFGFGDVDFVNSNFLYYLKNYFIIIIISIIFSMPVYSKIKQTLRKIKFPKTLFIIVLTIYVLLFIVTIGYIVNDTYNPFLYFRF